MANELQGSFTHGATCYFLLRNNVAQIWNISGFTAYSTPAYSGFPIGATEQGTASAYYVGTMPAGVPAGTYSAVMKQQIGANPAESDPVVDAGDIPWNGTTVAQLSDIPISGIPQPVQLQRGVMIKNYEFYLRASSDHITPLTSGVISGQISKDGGAFTALQSGAFTEIGFGFYSLQALTSGDTSCNTMGLLFTANGQQGPSDPLPQTFLLQHASGY